MLPLNPLAALLAALALLGCAGPPCPHTLDLYGSTTRGRVDPTSSHKRDADPGASYRERTFGAGVSMDLSRPISRCALYGGDPDAE